VNVLKRISSEKSTPDDLTVILLANGLEKHGGPFEAVVRYLSLYTNVPFLAVRHPLIADQRSLSEITQRNRVGEVKSISRWRPNFPPVTYLLDILFDPKTTSPRLWLTFNNLSALRAILRSKNGKELVILWSIDFVPTKSSSFLIQRVYKALDKFVHKRVSQHWEVSQIALEARIAESGAVANGVHKVVPMGIWGEAFFPSSIERFRSRKVAYFGSVNDRNGAEKLGDIIIASFENDLDITYEIIGGGSKLDSLMAKVSAAGAMSQVTFHGFIENEIDAYLILGNATIAIAPFIKDDSSFTSYADPSKFKAYLAASLPILTSDVPPNARELESKGGASVIESDSTASEYLDTIIRMMENQDAWVRKAKMAQEFGSKFEWKSVISNHLDPHLH
jgi:glycosyltransferase involved in cell wall biosynthesis